MQIITLANLGACFALVGEKIEVKRIFSPIVKKSGDCLLAAGDGTVVLLTADSTATLPPSSADEKLTVKNGSSGVIYIAGDIDGTAVTLTLLPAECYTFHGDGITWWVV